MLGGSQTWLNNSSKLLYVSGAVNNGGNLLTVAGPGNASFSGVISGGGGFTQNGPGLTTLTAVNTLTGTVVVNGGTLQTGGGNTGGGDLGSSTLIVVNSGATLAVASADNTLDGYTSSGAQQIQVNAGGLLINTLNAGNGNSTAHMDALVLNGGTLSAVASDATYGSWNPDYGISTPGNGAASYITGGNLALTEAGGTVFNVGAGDTVNVSSVIAHVTGSPDNGLIKSGAGTLVLTAANTYTSATTINGGTLQFSNSAAQTLSGGFAGSGGVLIQAGTGMTTQSGAGGFTGNIIVSGGTLQDTDARQQRHRERIGQHLDRRPHHHSQPGRHARLQRRRRQRLRRRRHHARVHPDDQRRGPGGLDRARQQLPLQRKPQWRHAEHVYGRRRAVPIVRVGWHVDRRRHRRLDHQRPHRRRANDGLNLGIGQAAGYQTTFNVGLTGTGGTVSSYPDLTISVPLANTGNGGNGAGTAAGLIMNGPGMMLLTGVNTYTGPTTISAGTLAIGGAGQLGGGNYAGAITNNAALIYNSTAAQTFSGVISGAGTLTQNGPGVLALTNTANAFQGGVTVANSVLEVGADGTLGFPPSFPTNNITLNNGTLYNNGGPLTLNADRNLTLSGTGCFQPAAGGIAVNGQIGGTGGLVVVWDSGILALNGSDSYTGGTVIGSSAVSTYNTGATASPTLQLGNSAALPPATSVIFGVHPNYPANTATLDLNGQNATVAGLTGGSNAILANSASSASSLTIAGSGGAFSGLLEQTNGPLGLVLNLTGTQSIGASPTGISSLQLNTGMLNLNGNSIAAGQFGGTGGTLTSNAAVAPVLTVSNGTAGAFAGSIVNGAGTPGLNLASGTLTLTGPVASNGPFAVGPGALLVLGQGSGTLQVGSLSGAGAVVGGNSSSGTLVVNYNGAAQDVFSGALGGPGTYQNNLALIKTGSGLLTLSGTDSFGGPTLVSSGVLNVTGSLGTTVTVASGGILQGSGNNLTTGIIGGLVTVGSGGAMNLAAGNTANSLTIKGGLTLGGNGAYRTSYSTLDFALGTSGVEAVDLGSAASPTGTLTVNSGGAYVSLTGSPPPGTPIPFWTSARRPEAGPSRSLRGTHRRSRSPSDGTRPPSR